MKIKIFEYLDYRDFLREMHLRMPSKGHGQLTKISQALNINPSIVTLVFKGSKNFTLEQANDLAEYLGFTELETDYLLASVNFARAGKTNLQTKYKQQLDKLKLQAKKVKERIPIHANIPDETKAVFYSQWYYSAIRLLSSIAEFDHVDGIATRLSLPRNKVKQTIDFLVDNQLCKEVNGRLTIGPQRTHIDAESPLVTRHHVNWRLRSIHSIELMKSDELFFTGPVSLSRSDIPRIRGVLVSAIEEILRIVDPSPAQDAACLNIDWFRI